MSIGWNFPSSGGGTDDGSNNAGIETFAGAPFEGLAREVIQNSLDAAIDDEQQVTVQFEFIKIKRQEFPNENELFDILKQCHKESQDKAKDEKEIEFFRNAARVLLPSCKEIPCLRISDSGTTGLDGDYENREGPWHAITKGEGITDKRDSTAGGSFGIGKSAPFTVSRLHTVFYSTLYKENGESFFRAQGKSILKSHLIKDKDREYTQGTGFWGEVNECKPLLANIPEFLQPEEQGTVVFIPGFVADKDWQHAIVATVVSNYFCAIDQEKLKVRICDENGETETIEKDTLEEYFQKVKGLQSGDNEKVQMSHYYYQAMKSAMYTKDAQLPNLGHCKMWILKGESLPNRVALLRKTGMLISDKQRGISRWTGCADFVAVFMCDSEKGNRLLRAMENPKHDAFEPERAMEKDQKKCKKALKELLNWVKECVNEYTKPEETETTAIDELGKFFPDIESPETIPGDVGERNIEGRPIYSPKPLKRAKPRVENLEDEDGDDGGASEVDGGGSGSDQPGGGSGHGEGTGGTGTRSSKPAMGLKNVRIVVDAIDPKKRRVYFTPMKSGMVDITLAIMGDDGKTENISIDDASNNNYISIDVKAGERETIDITLKDIMNDSIAVKALEKDMEKLNDEITTK